MSSLDEIRRLQSHVNQSILGQERLVERLIIALLADGHLLVEGVPGVGKTSAIKTLAGGLEGDFHRIQFTPDLLPADLIGTEVFKPQEGRFLFQHGPLFHNFLLADEINRAPAKVQSALLEAMAERQVTVGHTSYPMATPFLVMATQNPIEQEGTYPLPEAQRDRFLLYIRIGYPDKQAEREILRLVRGEMRERRRQLAPEMERRISKETLLDARRATLDLHLAPELEQYLVDLVTASRDPAPLDEELAGWIRLGASPRGTIALDLASRAHAWLAGRDYVSPADIHAVAPDVLCHRILPSYEAEADGIDSGRIVERLLHVVALP